MDMRGCTRHAEHEICLFLRVLDGLEAPWIKAYRGLHVTMRRDQGSSTLKRLFYPDKATFLILRNNEARSMAGLDCTQKRGL